MMEDVEVQLSPPAAPMPALDDISHDEVFQSNPEETELVIQRSQKQDSNTVIQRVRFKTLAKSRFSIPLCRLRCLPLVRPINDVDVARLENEFVMGIVMVTELCTSLFTTTSMRSFMSPMTSSPHGVHYGRRPMQSLMPFSKETPTLLALLTKCSMCGRVTID
jgi:hypothetical protein